MTAQFSQVILVNNTGADIRKFEDEILEAIHNGGTLPEELADLSFWKLPRRKTACAAFSTSPNTTPAPAGDLTKEL